MRETTDVLITANKMLNNTCNRWHVIEITVVPRSFDESVKPFMYMLLVVSASQSSQYQYMDPVMFHLINP